MSDIVERIDALLANTPAAEIEEFEVCRCLRDAKAAIESLRLAIRRLAEQDATLSVQGGSVTVTVDATLTHDERRAIDWAATMLEHGSLPKSVHRTDAETLRSLLERLQ
jgi:hypothetical protein